MSSTGIRVAKLEAAREAAHRARFAAEAAAAGWSAPGPNPATPDGVLEARIAAAAGMTPDAVRALIREDAKAFRRGARFADLRLAALEPCRDGGTR